MDVDVHKAAKYKMFAAGAAGTTTFSPNHSLPQLYLLSNISLLMARRLDNVMWTWPSPLTTLSVISEYSSDDMETSSDGIMASAPRVGKPPIELIRIRFWNRCHFRRCFHVVQWVSSGWRVSGWGKGRLIVEKLRQCKLQLDELELYTDLSRLYIHYLNYCATL